MADFDRVFTHGLRMPCPPAAPAFPSDGRPPQRRLRPFVTVLEEYPRDAEITHLLNTRGILPRCTTPTRMILFDLKGIPAESAGVGRPTPERETSRTLGRQLLQREDHLSSLPEAWRPGVQHGIHPSTERRDAGVRAGRAAVDFDETNLLDALGAPRVRADQHAGAWSRASRTAATAAHRGHKNSEDVTTRCHPDGRDGI